MLHRYSFSNAYSFRERVEVDLTLDQREPSTDWWAHTATGERVAKVAAVLGANASGKTSLLNAMAFMHWFVTLSFSQIKPGDLLLFEPYATDRDQPSKFEVEFDDITGEEVKFWRYSVKLTKERVLEETLYVRRKRMGLVFKRTWDAANNTYVVKDNGFGTLPIDVVNARPNASLLAIGAQYGLPIAVRFMNTSFRTNLTETGKELSDNMQLGRAVDFFFTNPDHQTALNRLLKSWDLGLASVAVVELSRPETDGQIKPVRMAVGMHTAKDATQFNLPFIRESRGTQAAFVLLSRLLPVLAEGGVAVIDEFESDLHPHMLAPILDLFANEQTNPHKAQLLFTCHSVEVLNLLPKSQVFLVEKDEHNESSAWRLDQVRGIRSDDNYYGKYMAGAYGAVPNL